MMAAKRGHMTVVGGPDPRDDYLTRLVKSNIGETKNAPFNFDIILEGDPNLKGLFAYDAFAQKILLTRKPPWAGGLAGEYSEHDSFGLATYLGDPENYSLACKPAQAAEAVEAISFRHSVHCVRDYLEGLKHDGTPRIEAMFSDYFGTPSDSYYSGVGVILMIGAVARILEPGCKVDHMVVLEGPQGAGKTSAVRALFCGSKWYADAQRSPAEKDFFQDLVGKWVVEIGEMSSFTKADTSRIKQVITAQSDTYRPSYARYSKTFPRQCVFFGTINGDDWQRDPTGGRRFLPVRVGTVDVPGIERDRDLLWAEAVARYKAGESWWKEPERAAYEQDQRYQEDSWTEPVLRWICGKASSSAYNDVPLDYRDKYGRILQCSVSQVMTAALHIDIARQDRTASTRVGTIMSRIGWKKYRPSGAGKRPWLWFAEADWEWPDAI